jgi:hypothetical protein
MTNLQHRQEKIQEKRKQTPWRDFLMEIASWYTINLNKNSTMVSRYPSNDRMGSIISKTEYESNWDQMNIINLDKALWFFEQLYTLRKIFKHPNILTFVNNESSDYSDVVFGAKNAYLSFTIWGNSENIFYSTICYINCRNILNSVRVTDHSENVYYSKVVTKSFNVFYSRYIDNSSDIRFSSNLIWCSNCIGCDSLINQSYCINNQTVWKERYEQEKSKILAQKDSFDKLFQSVNNKALNYQSENSTGVGISYSSNIQNGFYVKRASEGHNMIFVDWIDHADHYYDVFEAWVNSDHFYGVSNAGTNSDHLYCCTQMESSSNMFYCYHMENCSFCLGCIWLKNKSYCILNKQYTKEERYEKVDDIFTQMEKDWQLWEFFPATMNPFYFNDTAAYLIDPSFTKEEVTAKWYLRRDEPIKVDIPEGMEVVKTNELGGYEWYDTEWNRSINADILKKVIQDEQWNVYRIIPMEYKFLVKHGLPLPRKHWLERMKENFRIS